MVWVQHRTRIGGEATAREAETLAHSLPNDFAARIKDPCHDGGIEFRDIALEHPGPIHHRHVRDTDVILDHNTFPCQGTARCSFDETLLIPGVQRILFCRGTIAASSCIAHRECRFGELIDTTVRLKNCTQQTPKLCEVCIVQMHPIHVCDFA